VSYSEFGVDFACQRLDTYFAGKGKADEDSFVFGLIVGRFEGKVKGFFDEDVVGSF